MRKTMVIVIFVLLCWWGARVSADVTCDGADDDLTTGISLSTFMSASTGSMMLWYKPTGTVETPDPSYCHRGEALAGHADMGSGALMGLYRHGNLGGQNRLCAWNWDTDEATLPAAYTADAWTHLAWIHSGGTLSFYKDGALVTSAASGDTASMTGPVRLCLGPVVAATSSLVGEGEFVGFEVFDVEVSATEIALKAQARLHRIGTTVRTGAWPLDDCLPGTSGDGIPFHDVSGNERHITGDNGANDDGLTCLPNTVLTYPWGVE